MTVKLTAHTGELKRYAVDVECLTPDKRVREAYGGVKTDVLVFACSPEEAREAAAEKMQDKWLRHQDLSTQWKAFAVREA